MLARLISIFVLTTATILTGCGNDSQEQSDYGYYNYDAPRVVVVRYNNRGQAEYVTMSQYSSNMSQNQVQQMVYGQNGWQSIYGQQMINGQYPQTPNNGMYFINNPQQMQIGQGSMHYFKGQANDPSVSYWTNYAYSCSYNYGFYNYSNYCYNSSWYHVYPNYYGSWSNYQYLPTYYWPYNNYNNWYTGYYYYYPWYTWYYAGYYYYCYYSWWV